MKTVDRKKPADIVVRLHALAYNLWWSWNPKAQLIFEELSPLIWEISNHNPVAVLAQFSGVGLRARLGDRRFLKDVDAVLHAFEHYMSKKSTCDPNDFGRNKLEVVAYLCAEFGLHECLPFYSGGLGVLAGDHAKSASDLGLPFVGIGLFYRQGYFQQRVDNTGTQHESYPTTDPSTIPVELVKDPEGKPLLCGMTIGSTIVYFQAWKIQAGRCGIFLLDTDVKENEEAFRGLTAFAYGGDMNTRIRQEMILGIGGVKLLRALGVKPEVYHMNEGHAAFLTLELLREQLDVGLSKQEAEEAVRSQCIFTTHTPVPAGHDHFPTDLVEFHFRTYSELMKLPMNELLEYGRDSRVTPENQFVMTVLGLKFSRAANGVSKKHSETTSAMWGNVFDGAHGKKSSIGCVTNGVHVPSWTSRTSWEFWERHNSHKWKEHLNDPRFWNHVTNPKIVSDEELWALRCTLRRELIEFIRQGARHLHVIGGVHGEEALAHLLSSDALTIGFARRFAPYKRASLLFSNLSQAATLFSDPQRPIQIVFAGKAHPRDGEGKEFLRRIIDIAREHPFFGKVLFIEDYDMNIARYLVAGCDVWLNTPRRPFEASGTSGQKVIINGGLHVSVLDGWWYEAYNSKIGWAVGRNGDDNLSSEEIDRRDAESLYDILKNEVIPLFFDRDREGIPRQWIAKMRNAMRTIIPVYNTHRMVMDYAKKYYFPKK
ncbi:MAG: alpha-glucan family phosphorylase [Ignavibacteriae bacterium]|nr:alpha-glucan family phosphorylase [Ignavibacteriota bacterium]